MSFRSGWAWLPRILGFAGLFVLLTIVPLQVMAWVGVPLSGQPELANVLPMVAAALVSTWVFHVLVDRGSLAGLGLPAEPAALGRLAQGTGIGVVLIGLVVLLYAGLGWLAWEPDATPGSPLLAVAGLTGVLAGAAFVEELLFRGYPFRRLELRFGALAAIAATSVAFGALHWWNPNRTALSLLNITLAGVFLGVAYWRTRSLWFATGVHLGWNWVMAASELHVSGLDLEVPGFEPVLTGPALWTGGAFGPEGGLVVTLATIVGTIALWRLPAAEERLSAPPATAAREGE